LPRVARVEDRRREADRSPKLIVNRQSERERQANWSCSKEWAGGQFFDLRQDQQGAMIGRLRGIVEVVGEAYAIIDVNGVGYEVQASSRTLRTLQVGEAVSLAIETYVREDAIRLFGFTSEVERAWFRTLQTIQGVGAKVALAVLGTLSPQDLSRAIALSNWAAVEQSPGVGKKLAQRIVAELKDKAPALPAAALGAPASGRKGEPASIESNAAAEAISALINLGYQPAQASQAVAAAIAELGESADTPRLIRRGLKALAR
jgi:Holliday junction DNA helicase RuvA